MRIRERLLGRVKGGTRSLRSALTVSLLLLGALVLPSRPLAAAPTTLVNVGMQPSWDCSDPAISGDGRYVAFSTSAGNIVPLDENHARDVFVYDRQTGHTERVSVASDGTEGNHGSFAPAMSADGRWVAFLSGATNLVAGDTNGAQDVFVHDRVTGQSERVSVASDGTQAMSESLAPCISADGRYVAFLSSATGLVAGDTNGKRDVFVHDRDTGVTERVSVASSGTQADGDCLSPAISADGRYVAFSSEAANLVLDDTNGTSDVFVHDRDTGVTERVSVASDGTEGSGHEASMSGDGRHVAFASGATSLVEGDTNGVQDVFVHARDTGVTERVSVASDGTEADAHCYGPSISADGGCVAFHTAASNLVSGDTNGARDVFVHDRQTAQTERASVATDGTQGDDHSWVGKLSADGRYVAFASDASNMAPGDFRWLLSDILVRDRETQETERINWAHDGSEAYGASEDPRISGEGRYVAFASEATELLAGADSNGARDVFVRDLQAGWTERASVCSDGTEGSGDSDQAAISGDGQYVAFRSLASDLIAGDTNILADILVHDRQTGATERVSVASDATQANGASESPSISVDGQYVAFQSDASNLVSGDTNGVTDVFVHNRQTGETERISVASDGAQGDGASTRPSISGDGRYVAFQSSAINLTVGDTNGAPDIFAHDRQTGTTQRVSVASDGAQGSGDSSDASISSDGRYVAFCSNAANLVPGDTNHWQDVFVRDLQTGQTGRVSVASDGTEATGPSFSPSLNADGRYVVFASVAHNLVAGDSNGRQDIFLHDRLTETTERVSVSSAAAPGDGDSVRPCASDDGRYVAFQSDANSLVPDLTDGTPDVFLRERPVAAFSATPTGGGSPLSVHFTDLSTGSASRWGGGSWQWDFGDGGSSALQNPTHEYAASGSYTVTLTLSDGAGSDTATKVGYITVTAQLPSVIFSASPTSGPAPLMVSFTDLSTGDPTSWSWDFGDGGSSTVQNPSHEYYQAGTHAVSLTAANAAGSDTETKPDYVTVTFADVDWGHWACDEVMACVDAGIVGGYPDGTYQPDWPVTRDQMAVYISRALAGGDESVPEFSDAPTFPDVDEEHWGLKYVQYAVDQSVVGGYDDGSYHPDYQVDRGQMAVYIARSLVAPDGEDGLAGYIPADPRDFPDVPDTFWAYKHVEYCVENGVVAGYGDGLYHPDRQVTRGQMAVYIARAFGLLM